MTTSYVLSGAALGIGTAGLGVATATNISHGKKLKALDANNIEAHILKCEQSISTHAVAIRELQDVMVTNGMMSTR